MEHGFFYMVATAVEGPVVAHPTLVVKTLPDLRYARFTHQGPLQDLGLTLGYIYHTWLPKSGHNLALPLEVESFGQHLGPMGSKDGEWGFYIPVQGQHSRAQ
jgi:AraC family transcriptional regulator